MKRRTGPKTMEWNEFKRLCVINSPKVPPALIAGERHVWVGFGLVNEGTPEGDETLITENGKIPVRQKGKIVYKPVPEALKIGKK